MTEKEARERTVAMFREATPTRVDAPIEEWRQGFSAMAAKIPLPADLAIEPWTVAGVPGYRVAAPGVDQGRIVVHFHSGGYVMGCAHDYREFGGRLSAACGAPVFVPDYRLAPEHVYPAAAEDGLAIYTALLERFAPGQIILSGDSAGGGLCMSTLLGARDGGLPQPAGAIAICPLLDLAGEGDSADIPSDPLIGRDLIVGMGSVYIGERDPHEHPRASPLWGEHHGLAPLYLLASSSEALRDDAVRLAASIGRAQGKVRLSLYPDVVHIWTFFPFLESTREAMGEIAGFARDCWGSDATAAKVEPGYLIVQASISDPEGFGPYVAAVQPLIAAHGGKMVVRAFDPPVLEGEWPWQTFAVLQFPSAEAINAFWYSPEYAEVIKLRDGVAQFQVLSVSNAPA
ncbi:alpha/beta hydrolase fold domain-containing protein [Novosphingobium colocasiae]|uniref:Alpha/beta hydrolase n=1 Tax=Novosphingobium colocasiae TaxID=1256513 RepID=A0A918UDC3_9SPHN|nr:alpha/beta hydrolase fold domain-containing protein [Novosphingobium colocasiae]GGY95868.1 hypothetical protein GCM10011614_08270 [Novosphingobium colocasiae]